MKHLILLLLLGFSFTLSSQEFITDYDFEVSITSMPFWAKTSGQVNYTWETFPSGNSGSGSFDSPVLARVTIDNLNVEAGDILTVYMTPDSLKQIEANANILNVAEWGDVEWESMNSMFSGCLKIRFPAIDSPDLSQVTDMSRMFYGCRNFRLAPFIGNWDVSNVINMSKMFYNCRSFNVDIGAWMPSAVEDMSFMFNGCIGFNREIENWDVGSLINMDYMFAFSGYEQDLNGWDVSNVQSMRYTFHRTDYNGDISLWNTMSVESFEGMFYLNPSFNQDLSAWNTSSCTNMGRMFDDASAFNQDLNNWNTSNVETMFRMFFRCNQFNYSLNDWDVSSVEDMSNMFNGATVFNGDISSWDTRSLRTAENMFISARAFNQDIGGWDVSSLNNLSSMFFNTRDFNQDLSNWDLSAARFLTSMFSSASGFDQNLGDWQFNRFAELNNMLDRSGLSCENYSATLIGWETNAPTLISAELGAIDLEYGTNAESTRDNLILNRGWVITGDSPSGTDCSIVLPVDFLSFHVESISSSRLALHWTVREEYESEGYVVQLRFNEDEFTDFAFVESENIGINSYVFELDRPKSERICFRIKEIDSNGLITYSKVECIQSQIDSSSDLAIYPNPVKDIIYVEHFRGELRIYDKLGSLVRTVNISNSNQPVHIGDLDPGVYTLNTQYGSQRFIKVE